MDSRLVGSFLICLKESFCNPELLQQYNRLNGTHLGKDIERSSITKMIDDATGYQEFLDKQFSLEMIGFMCFVGKCVWMPLMNNKEGREELLNAVSA